MRDGIIPRLSTRLTVLAARFYELKGQPGCDDDPTFLIEAARALERGDPAGRAVDFGRALDGWASRFGEIGDEVGESESLRLVGLAQMWKRRR